VFALAACGGGTKTVANSVNTGAQTVAAVSTVATQTATSPAAHTATRTSGPLTGTWIGNINPGPGSTVRRHGLRIVVDAGERGGSWRINARCGGPLRLQSISGGFHHYREELARGSTCRGGGIDCLKRAGAGLYDLFQAHFTNYNYYSDGTLNRVAA
jgi:hypothetical protein